MTQYTFNKATPNSFVSTKTDAETIADYETSYHNSITGNTWYFPDWKKDGMKKVDVTDCKYEFTAL